MALPVVAGGFANESRLARAFERAQDRAAERNDPSRFALLNKTARLFHSKLNPRPSRRTSA